MSQSNKTVLVKVSTGRYSHLTHTGSQVVKTPNSEPFEVLEKHFIQFRGILELYDPSLKLEPQQVTADEKKEADDLLSEAEKREKLREEQAREDAKNTSADEDDQSGEGESAEAEHEKAPAPEPAKSSTANAAKKLSQKKLKSEGVSNDEQSKAQGSEGDS